MQIIVAIIVLVPGKGPNAPQPNARFSSAGASTCGTVLMSTKVVVLASCDTGAGTAPESKREVATRMNERSENGENIVFVSVVRGYR